MIDYKKTRFESVMADREVRDDLLDLFQSRRKVRVESNDVEELVSKRAIVNFLDDAEHAEGLDAEQRHFSEAIVLAVGRPSLLIQQGRLDLSRIQLPSLKKRLERHLKTIEAPLPSIGRVELLSHPSFEWVGTGWLLPNRVLVTNRHVAEVFSEREGSGFRFKRFLSETVHARVDFLEEFRRAEDLEIRVEKILFVSPAGSAHPDIAFLRISEHPELPDPLTLADKDPEPGQQIGVVGYPARDGLRNPGNAMSRIFRDIYDVKRFAPGLISSADGRVLMHDCSTLGGNSGSPVLDHGTGSVVGLHFAGRFMSGNFAVPVSVVKRELRRIGTVLVPVPDVEQFDLESLENRHGYSDDFLGRGDQRVRLPALSTDLEDQAAPVRGRERSRGIGKYVLDYTHFSVVMNRVRRLAIYTAVNIDGTQEVVVRRRRTTWRTDPRIPLDQQFDNDLYFRNRLDRGHLVRRLDPVWGSDDEARQANEDTFHYTNAAPQHESFNQRSWLSLEDYLLSNTNRDDQKLSVFTGPIFSDCGRRQPYRGATLPDEFWKVAVMATDDGSLLATGYLLSQTRFLNDLEFVVGAFRTYQTPIAVIEQKTGLSFGLSDFDPLAERETLSFPIITSAQDIVLG